MSSNVSTKVVAIDISVRVYIEDTDAGGIVYYVNYLKFMERARTELLRSLGYGKAAIFADDLMFVVHSLNANYRASAKLDDELQVSAKVTKVSKVAVVFEQTVSCGDQVLCDGEVKVACVKRGDQKPVKMPPQLLEQLGI
ncbi:MAG: tol-pal system-associated acyl-CoA thioesterase [Pseudomonadales bacterium]|nr:tol-pal system-associated acyl-CoA thioesterase [Pseudomonadales bacterium]